MFADSDRQPMECCLHKRPADTGHQRCDECRLNWRNRLYTRNLEPLLGGYGNHADKKSNRIA